MTTTKDAILERMFGNYVGELIELNSDERRQSHGFGTSDSRPEGPLASMGGEKVAANQFHGGSRDASIGSIGGETCQ